MVKASLLIFLLQRDLIRSREDAKPRRNFLGIPRKKKPRTLSAIIRGIILSEADKLHAQWPKVYEEIHHNDRGDVLDLVDTLMRVLKKSLDESCDLAGYAERLDRRISDLRAGGDSAITREHRGEIANLNETHANEIQGYVSHVSQLKSDVSRLEREKRAIENDKYTLENEVVKLKRNNDGQRKEMEKRLREDFNVEKGALQSRLQVTHGNEMRGLQAIHDADKDRLQKEHKTEKEGLRSRISTLEADLESEKKYLHAKISEMQREHESKRERLLTRISDLKREHKSEKDRMQEEHESNRAQLLAKMVEMKQEHDSETHRERQEHESKRERLLTTISDMKREHKSEQDRMQEEHDSILSQMQKEHDSTIGQMQEEHDSIIGQMSQEHESKRERLLTRISDMKQAHKSEKDRMQEEHDSILGRMQADHESNQAQLLAKMVEMKQKYDTEQEQMRKDVEARKLELERQKSEEEARLKSEFETKKAQLEAAHAAEKKRLRKDIEAYSGALLARDDFKPMPDNEVKARFLDLAQEVDALARLEWKPNQKNWTDQVLLRLAGNQRLLRKQILQNSVWVILHENIFCSPFRIFGEEGRSLESQWSDEYGKGWLYETLPLSLLWPALTSADSHLDNGSYIWPEPSIDAERWRYATIKECRAALEKAASELDPRARVRKGFKSSLDALKQKLTSTLEEVSNLDKSSVQAAESIVKKAAKMWLEFGMQRCRILVIVQGSSLKSAEERIQRAQEATLKLVMVPELKRFGNSKGQDVHIEETVGRCDGEMVEVSMTR